MTRGVLFVSNFLSGSGLNRVYADELTDRLEARGWPVTRTSTQLGKLQRLADMLRTAWATRRRYDIAHVDVFSGAAFVWAEAVCFELRRLGKPYALTLRGGNLPSFAREWPRRVRALLRSAALVTVPSRYLAETMRAYREQLVLCRNAIDTRAIEFRARARAAPRLVWLRAFHDVYNPLLALDVLAAVHRDHPDATLRMIGPDKGARTKVERAIRERGLADRVELVGPVAKTAVPTELAKGDIFLNTTDVDNTPISVLEAMAVGLCVVTTSAGGIPYLVEHEREALVVPPRDGAAMTAAVTRVLEEPVLAERLSRGARELAAAHDWAPVLAQWEDHLSQLA